MFFGNISQTWELMGQSWRVLKQDKELLVFPLVSGICCLLVMASFAIPSIMSDSWMPPTAEQEGQSVSTSEQVGYYAKLFVFYFCNYFVIIFFNSAIAGCAAMRMRGQDPTVGDGFSIAFSRIHAIFGWALVSATVGLILRIIEDKNRKIGAFVASLLGTAWTLVSFLVLPILVIENVGPFAALKKSTALFKRTWGAQIGANFSFGLIFFLLALPAIGIVVLGFLSQSGIVIGICIAIAVIYCIVLSLIQSTLGVIFQTALYTFADTGEAPMGFDAAALNGAVRQK
ncbi:MAG: DUF6159 family protein [Planctomycetota bacterium]|jgi:hypothetical protein